MDGEGSISDEPDTWAVFKKDQTNLHHYLPKSEYRLCDPPEVWRDVTERVEVKQIGSKQGPVIGERVYHDDVCLADLKCGGAYRLMKVDLREHNAVPNWVFVVEKKVS